MIRYRFSNAEIREVTELMETGLEPPLDLHDPAGLRRWLHQADPGLLTSFGRIWLGKARLDQLHGDRNPGPVLDLLRRLRSVVRGRPPLTVGDLALTGRDLISLGMKPSPRFGEILDRLLEMVLDEPGLNTRERLVTLVQTGELGGEAPE